MPHDYESAYKEAYKVNTDDTPRAVKDGELDVKIDNFCELHGFDRDAVAKEIQENRILSAIFAKDPAKQKFHEKEAARLIETIDNVENFTDLHNCKLYLVGGAVLDRNVIESGAYPNAKTIDFEWVYRGCRFYASHKYTKSSGGSQGSAYKDLQMFIIEANLTTLQQTFFIAIADGAFYQKLNGKANTTRIQRLKDMANKSKVFACEITELESLMDNLTN